MTSLSISSDLKAVAQLRKELSGGPLMSFQWHRKRCRSDPSTFAVGHHKRNEHTLAFEAVAVPYIQVRS